MIDLKATLMNNTLWKIVSIFLAILLWFLVINIENPQETKTYTGQIALTNIEFLTGNDMVIANQSAIESTYVTLKIKGSRLAQEELRARKSEIQAIADCSKAIKTGNNFQLTLDIELPSISGLEVSSKLPSSLDITLDEKASADKKIEAVLTGTPPSGYIRLTPQILPDTITVQGGKQALEKIVKTVANIDVTDETEDVTVDALVKFYGENDKEISGLTYTPENITVTVPIRQTKSIPINPVTTSGFLPEGYILDTISTSIDSLTIAGTSASLALADSITIPDISLSGRFTSFSVEVSTSSILPKNTIQLASAPKTITVNVKISRRTQTTLPQNTEVTSTTETISQTTTSEATTQAPSEPIRPAPTTSNATTTTTTEQETTEETTSETETVSYEDITSLPTEET